MTYPLTFSRGRNIHDNAPQQLQVRDFAALIEQLEQDRSEGKEGSPYICSPLAGRRGAETVQPRRVLAVDADRIDAATQPDFRLWFARFSGCAWPTHSSTPDAPRERVLVELDRDVTRDEAIQIGRALTEELREEFGDLVLIDPSTFRGEQPVFVPPTGATLARFDGDPLDVDRYLKAAAGLPTVNGSAGGAGDPLAAIKTGEGLHDAIARLVARMAGKGLRRDEIHLAAVGLLENARSARGGRVDEMAGSELDRLIDGAMRKFSPAHQEAPGPDQPACGEDREWPDPKEIKADLPPAPVFDGPTLLPEAICEFVIDEAGRMPCPPDYIAAALIVYLGSAIGARLALKPKRNDDWIVTPNLFGGAVGDPATKKSPALASVKRFGDRLEAKETKALVEKVKEHAAETAAFEAQQSAVQAKMKKAASTADAAAMRELVAEMAALEAPVEPLPRRFHTSDPTVEKLGDLLTKNPAGLLVFRDELMGLLASWEKEGHEGDRAFYLEGHNGTGSFNIDRIGRGSQHIPNVCLSIFGGIQPDLCERYLAKIVDTLDNDGRFQRFQVLVYPDPSAWQWSDRLPADGPRGDVRDLFDRLAELKDTGAQPPTDFVKLPYLRFSEDAQALFVEWSTELHREWIAGETNPMLAQHFGKYEKLFCAIALILHLAESGRGEVQVKSVLRAAAWCQYLADHARRIYAMAEAMNVTNARQLGRRLAGGKLPTGFTARDVAQKRWAGMTTAADADAALEVLEAHGWIRGTEREDHPGRPTTRYAINPKIWRKPQ